NRVTNSTPTPSAHPVPSALSENDLHRPSADNPRWRLNSMSMPGAAITVAPPASAIEHSPRRSDWTARCNATTDDEHTVSTVSAAPWSPSTYEPRPDATLGVLPVSR